MNSTIWKLPLRFPGPTVMPAGARILHVGQQAGTPYAWAVVDPGAPAEKRDLLVLGTGHDVPQSAAINQRAYLGTIVGVEGGLVLHVFDEELPF